IIGQTPFATDHQMAFARELITQEKLGQGPTTDLLLISISANDILGHKVGPNSDESKAMVQAIDTQLAGFFEFLGKQVGLGNVWLALSADHGIANAPSYVTDLHIPGAYLSQDQLRDTLNEQLHNKLDRPANSQVKVKKGVTVFVPKIDWPLVLLNSQAFIEAKVSEADAERMVADLLKMYSRGYYTKTQIAANRFRPTASEGCM